MFTGLIEARGVVREVLPRASAVDIAIEPPVELQPAGIGDSIAINGCCLTVVQSGATWVFQVGTETLSRTNLGELDAGDRVNLERSLAANGRIGGHFVQGHIDGVGRVALIDRDGEWVHLAVDVEPRLTRQMVEKGSVTVDGVSLTLTKVEAARFHVALIPHTLDVTTLGERAVGASVNVETDILGKYLEKFLGGETGIALG